MMVYHVFLLKTAHMYCMMVYHVFLLKTVHIYCMMMYHVFLLETEYLMYDGVSRISTENCKYSYLSQTNASQRL